MVWLYYQPYILTLVLYPKKRDYDVTFKFQQLQTNALEVSFICILLLKIKVAD